MKTARRHILKALPLLVRQRQLLHAAEGQSPYIGQGAMCGEVTQSTAFIQTRLTSATELDANGDLPGANGVRSQTAVFKTRVYAPGKYTVRVGKDKPDLVISEGLEAS